MVQTADGSPEEGAGRKGDGMSKPMWAHIIRLLDDEEQATMVLQIFKQAMITRASASPLCRCSTCLKKCERRSRGGALTGLQRVCIFTLGSTYGSEVPVTDMRACSAYASACHAQLRLIEDPHGGYYDEGRVWHPHVKAPAQATRSTP